MNPLLCDCLCLCLHDLLSGIVLNALMTNTKPAAVMRYQFHKILIIYFKAQHSGFAVFSYSLTIIKQLDEMAPINSVEVSICSFSPLKPHFNHIFKFLVNFLSSFSSLRVLIIFAVGLFSPILS